MTMATTDLHVGAGRPDVYDQLLAYARFAGEVQGAAERAGSLAELHAAIRAAQADLNATLNREVS